MPDKKMIAALPIGFVQEAINYEETFEIVSDALLYLNQK